MNRRSPSGMERQRLDPAAVAVQGRQRSAASAPDVPAMHEAVEPAGRQESAAGAEADRHELPVGLDQPRPPWARGACGRASSGPDPWRWSGPGRRLGVAPRGVRRATPRRRGSPRGRSAAAGRRCRTRVAAGSMPRARNQVWNRWPMSCSSPATHVPLSLVLPTTTPRLMPAAGHRQRPGLRPVVAADVAVDPRRAAELRHRDHQHVVEHARGRPGPRSGRRTAWSNFGHQAEVAVEVVAVRVPAVGGDLDEGHARLEQPPGQQHVPAEVVRAVALDVRGRQLGRVEQVASASATARPCRRRSCWPRSTRLRPAAA